MSTAPASLVGSDGTKIALPQEIYDVLLDVVHATIKHQAISVTPIDQMITTQQAADFLGMSRPTLIRLLDHGDIPFERPTGSRHRRIKLSDVVDYQTRLRAKRRAILKQLAEDAEEDGLYDDTYGGL